MFAYSSYGMISKLFGEYKFNQAFEERLRQKEELYKKDPVKFPDYKNLYEEKVNQEHCQEW